MAAVRGGVSSGGSSNTRRADHLLPLPCNRDPAAASCASSGSSPARAKAAHAATCYGADALAKPTPEVEASAGNNTKTLLAISSTGGSRPPPCDRAGPLTHHSPASPSSCFRGGGSGGYRQTHGGEDASSSVTLTLEKGQGRLPTRADFMKPCSTLQLGLSHNSHQHVHAIDPINDSIVPEVSEEEDGVNEQDWQTDTAPTHISSVCDGAFEDRKHSARLVKPSAMPRNIRLQIPRDPSLLSTRVDGISSDDNHQHVDALDNIDEWRLHEDCVVTTKCIGQSSSTTSNSSKFAPVSLGKVKDKAAIVHSASADKSGGTVGSKKKEAYMTTLGTRGGYGDPHPPPFYKCEACRKGTAFYRLKCCRLVVCEGCGCACEPAEAVPAVEDEKLLSRRGKVQAGKEKLPKVKLEGPDLFLWQPCSFPATLKLCMAKRVGNYLQYYFAPVDDLMNPEVKLIKATVYTFRQHGRDARSLSVRDQLLTRKQLRQQACIFSSLRASSCASKHVSSPFCTCIVL